MAAERKLQETVPVKEVIKADIAKLHSEINSYVNHQYILQVAGLTILGVVLAWVSQQLKPADFRTLDVAYLGCSAVLLFLCVMNVMDFRLEMGRTICATYLRLSGWSVWESMIEEYKNASPAKRWLAITSRHGFYALLGLIAMAWPAALAWAVFQASTTSWLSLAHIGVCAFYLVFTVWFMPRRLRITITGIELGWQTILASAKDAK